MILHKRRWLLSLQHPPGVVVAQRLGDIYMLLSPNGYASKSPSTQHILLSQELPDWNAKCCDKLAGSSLQL
eukprot:5975083-Amphidinium_carterae.1